jgi:hypothetical protein
MLVVEQVEIRRTRFRWKTPGAPIPAPRSAHHRRHPAAAGIWPDRGAIGQAGDRAEGARGRARPAISGIQDRIGDIVNGIVKRVEYGSVIVDLGRGEAIVRRDEMLPREVFRNGDRVAPHIFDVRRETRGPQIFLSRTHPQFMAKLFAQEVPEIYDGIVEIKAVARDPGSRAKSA